jgi:hypothetical protein
MIGGVPSAVWKFAPRSVDLGALHVREAFAYRAAVARDRAQDRVVTRGHRSCVRQCPVDIVQRAGGEAVDPVQQQAGAETGFGGEAQPVTAPEMLAAIVCARLRVIWS